MKQEQAKLAASSIDSIVNGGDSGKEPIIAGHAEVAVAQVEVKTLVAQPAEIAGPSEGVTVNPKGREGPIGAPLVGRGLVLPDSTADVATCTAQCTAIPISMTASLTIGPLLGMLLPRLIRW